MHPRRIGRVGVALILAAAGALGVYGCSDTGGDAAPAPVDREGPAEGAKAGVASTTSAPAPVGLPLVVAEQGFSTFPDPLAPGATLGGYAVVVANPDPALMATGVTVRSRLVGEDGTAVFADSALLNAVMPASSMAVGGTLLEPLTGPVHLEVELSTAAWLEPSEPGGRIEVVAAVTEPVPGGGARTRFTLRSSRRGDEEGVDVTALYRAADGRLLAGEQTTVALVEGGASVDGEITLLAPIPDLSRTDVLVGRGFGAQTTG